MPGPVFFFFIVVGLVTLGVSVRFAFKPAERVLAMVRPLCAATTFSSLAAFFAGVVNGLAGVTRLIDSGTDTARIWRLAIGGFAESPIALVAGFAIVSVAWLLVAVGLRRQL